MNTEAGQEYAVTLKIRWWGLFLPHSAVETFAVSAISAAQALALARSGLVSGLEHYDQSFDGEGTVDLSHLGITVLAVARV